MVPRPEGVVKCLQKKPLTVGDGCRKASFHQTSDPRKMIYWLWFIGLLEAFCWAEKEILFFKKSLKSGFTLGTGIPRTIIADCADGRFYWAPIWIRNSAGNWDGENVWLCVWVLVERLMWKVCMWNVGCSERFWTAMCVERCILIDLIDV